MARRTLSFVLNEDLSQAIEDLRWSERKTLSDMIREALADYIKKSHAQRRKSQKSLENHESQAS